MKTPLPPHRKRPDRQQRPFRQSYQSVEVKNGGIIKGEVKWIGSIPSPVVVKVTKDTDHCGKTKQLPRLIIGPNDGVQNTLVYLTDIAKGKQLEKPTEPPLLNQVKCEYIPHILIVPVGGEVLLGNDDNHLHSIHGTLYPSGDTVFNIAQPGKSMRERRPIKKAGIIELMCHAGHTWMSGYIVAVSHTYFALTGEDGKFEITDVPPGSYILRAWHEGWNVVGQVTHADTSGAHHAAAFERPHVTDRKVQVKPKESVQVNFEFSDLSAAQLAKEKEQAQKSLAQQVADPVCGMSIDPKSAKHTADYNGKKLYFCSKTCKRQFIAQPEKFISTVRKDNK